VDWVEQVNKVSGKPGAQRSTINGQRSTFCAQRSTINGQRSAPNGQRSTANDQQELGIRNWELGGGLPPCGSTIIDQQELGRCFCTGVRPVFEKKREKRLTDFGKKFQKASDTFATSIRKAV
jgi:hypothetical protein